MGETFNPRDYNQFIYRGYSFDGPGIFHAYYSLVGPGDSIDFTESIRLPGMHEMRERAPHRIARLLALACGLSYYKAAAPRAVHVEFGLTLTERTFLSELIRNGLGEFAFRNQLPEALVPEITGEHVDRTFDGTPSAQGADGSTPLVPVGGGKDSVVTIESIKRVGFRLKLFSVNAFTPISRCAEVSGLELLTAQRTIDRTLISINSLGAYNGHIPVTAINSLIALLAADLLAVGPVVMSNERSAEYGNLEWNGLTVNHQWSKSIEFEKLLQFALNTPDEPAPYFSLLRPISEIDIARRFAKLPSYFSAFTSCNRAFALDASKRAAAWCRTCPKCQFVFLILAPFIPRGELEDIFGGNVLEMADNMSGYREILGLSGHKPFECVGEYSEAALALVMLSDREDWENSASLVELTEELRRQGKTPSLEEHERLLRPTSEHFIPLRFQEALHALA